MANSLRAKLSKLRHDGHITDAEYQAFIKKMDGHDREIRNKAIDDFAEHIKFHLSSYHLNSSDVFVSSAIHKVMNDAIDMVCEIAEQMKEGAE